MAIYCSHTTCAWIYYGMLFSQSHRLFTKICTMLLPWQWDVVLSSIVYYYCVRGLQCVECYEHLYYCHLIVWCAACVAGCSPSTGFRWWRRMPSAALPCNSCESPPADTEAHIHCTCKADIWRQIYWYKVVNSVSATYITSIFFLTRGVPWGHSAN